MYRFFVLSFVSSFLLVSNALAQVSVVISSIPDNTPANATLYIVGTFNNWDPADSDFALEKQADNTYQVELPAGEGELKYKFTRGAWESVEGDVDGDEIADRTFIYGNGQTINVQILSWKDLANAPGGDGSTAAENVTILSNEFYMPQLDRNRRVWLFLPKDYQTSTERYPVIYMHDAQNLFDDNTSFSGEWKVDEALNTLAEMGATQSIIIGIDNGGGLRVDELTPWSHPSYGGGDGDQYVRFITETLKPYVDENYRTKPDREYTGVMGSSLGGLISYYAAMQYPEVFGMAGIFSPSFWFSDEVYPLTRAFENEYDSRFFFLMGEKESDSGVADINAVISELEATGFESENINLVLKADGTHSEWFWAREFAEAYLWMIGEEHLLVTGAKKKVTTEPLTLFPNPVHDYLSVRLSRDISLPQVSVYGVTGKLMHSSVGYFDSTIRVKVASWPTGLYVIQLKMGSTLLTQSFYKD